MDNNMLKEIALEWWNGLTEAGKSMFPEPNDIDDIVSYYQDPADYTLPPNITY